MHFSDNTPQGRVVPIETLTFTRKEFEYLKALQSKRRWDWPATFSTNFHGEIWPFSSYGYTRNEDREQVRGLSVVVDQVADAYLRVRGEGGRFFICEDGAFYPTGENTVRPIALFEIR